MSFRASSGLDAGEAPAGPSVRTPKNQGHAADKQPASLLTSCASYKTDSAAMLSPGSPLTSGVSGPLPASPRQASRRNSVPRRAPRCHLDGHVMLHQIMVGPSLFKSRKEANHVFPFPPGSFRRARPERGVSVPGQGRTSFHPLHQAVGKRPTWSSFRWPESKSITLRGENGRRISSRRVRAEQQASARPYRSECAGQKAVCRTVIPETALYSEGSAIRTAQVMGMHRVMSGR
jgi:hypothetical protein